ncbi:hypothetical protein T10_3635, partial [Trichinella papuae]
MTRRRSLRTRWQLCSVNANSYRLCLLCLLHIQFAVTP